MAIPLSPRTETVLQTLFDASDQQRLRARLLAEVSETIPCCSRYGPEQMERIRFAVLKRVHEQPDREDLAFGLAYMDWRDLLMDAGFGDVPAYMAWNDAVCRESGESGADA